MDRDSNLTFSTAVFFPPGWHLKLQYHIKPKLLVGRKAEAGGASPEVHADVGPHSQSADVGGVQIRPPLQESPSPNHNDFPCEIYPKSNHRAALCGFHILSQGSSTCFCFWGSAEKCSSQQWLGKEQGLAVGPPD